MSTEKQKAVAKLIVENASLDKPLNGGELLESAGYSKPVTTYPARVLESTGVQEELEVMGFTIDSAKRVVSEIMHNDKVEPNARLKATDQVFKVRGAYAPEKKEIELSGTVNTQDPKHIAIAEKYEQEIKQQL